MPNSVDIVAVFKVDVVDVIDDDFVDFECKLLEVNDVDNNSPSNECTADLVVETSSTSLEEMTEAGIRSMMETSLPCDGTICTR